MVKFYSSINNTDRIKLDDRIVWIEELIEGENFLSSLACLKPNKENDRLFDRSKVKNLFLDSGAYTFREKPYENPYLDIPTAIKAFSKYGQPGDMLCSPDVVVPKLTEEDRDFMLKIGKEFLQVEKEKFKAVGVLHGNLNDRLYMLERYLDMGYIHIAHGGVAHMASSKESVIMNYVESMRNLYDKYHFSCHMFGVSSVRWFRWFKKTGLITSVDSASPYLGGVKNGNFFIFDDTIENLIRKYNVRQDRNIPTCKCKVCKFCLKNGINSLKFGNGNGNLSRGIHDFKKGPVKWFMKKKYIPRYIKAGIDYIVCTSVKENMVKLDGFIEFSEFIKKYNSECEGDCNFPVEWLTPIGALHYEINEIPEDVKFQIKKGGENV